MENRLKLQRLQNKIDKLEESLAFETNEKEFLRSKFEEIGKNPLIPLVSKLKDHQDELDEYKSLISTLISRVEVLEARGKQINRGFSTTLNDNDSSTTPNP